MNTRREATKTVEEEIVNTASPSYDNQALLQGNQAPTQEQPYLGDEAPINLRL